MGLPNSVLPDGGPWYAETDLSSFPVEPWNAFSSLTFLLPAFWIIWKMYLQKNQQLFLWYCAALLSLGGIGSTLYHAFRSNSFWLLMDVVPIAVLTMSVSMYFWWQILKQKYWVFVITVSVFILRYGLFTLIQVEIQTAINISYFISGTYMLLPALLWLRRNNGSGFGWFMGTLFFLVLALICRALDEVSAQYWAQGIHWLWHLNTAIAAYFLGEFLFLMEKMKGRS